MIAVGEKLKRYANETKQCTQNCLFESHQKKLLDGLEGKVRENFVPDVEGEEMKIFWFEILYQQVKQ